MKCILTDLVV